MGVKDRVHTASKRFRKAGELEVLIGGNTKRPFTHNLSRNPYMLGKSPFDPAFIHAKLLPAFAAIRTPVAWHVRSNCNFISYCDIGSLRLTLYLSYPSYDFVTENTRRGKHMMSAPVCLDIRPAKTAIGYLKKRVPIFKDRRVHVFDS
jgi:hypothetical protein